MTEQDREMRVPLWIVARVAAFAAAFWFHAPHVVIALALWTTFDGGYLARGWLDRRRAARLLRR
jgi:hypothetical protein